MYHQCHYIYIPLRRRILAEHRQNSWHVYNVNSRWHNRNASNALCTLVKREEFLGPGENCQRNLTGILYTAPAEELSARIKPLCQNQLDLSLSITVLIEHRLVTDRHRQTDAGP